MEGTVVLTLLEQERGASDPEPNHVLQGGDAATIQAGIARRWQNLSPAPVVILIVSGRLGR